MIQEITSWITENYIEIIAATIGIISMFFGIKEKAFFWILATINAILFVYVYFNAKIYALMFLQFYFITINIYGFYYWIKGGKTENKNKVPVTNITKKGVLIAASLYITIFLVLSFILNKFTDSPIPFLDSFIATSNIFAAYFMMKKYIESWYIWIVSDTVAIGMLISQQLFAVTILQTVYLIFAIIGYFEWKKSLQAEKEISTE